MGRNQKEVYFDPKGNSYYARFTVEEKLYRLSLNTRAAHVSGWAPIFLRHQFYLFLPANTMFAGNVFR